jgi:F0F1-type ATP synthase membrane subunit b/b'
VEARLKRLDDEMGEMRRTAFAESLAEGGRIEETAKAEAEKILHTAEQEIEAAVKAARQELKTYTAELAVGAAEQKIRKAMTPETEQRILRSFVKELGADGAAGGNGRPEGSGEAKR